MSSAAPSDPPEQPAEPKPAATLILFDASAAPPRLLMGRRPAGMAFMPNVWVFPGGAVEPQDAQAEAEDPLDARDEALLRLKAPTLAAAGYGPDALAACALREAAEETGLTLRRRRAPLRFVFRAITPPHYKRRYDARFFLAPADALVEGPLDAFHAADDELEALAWSPVAEAVGRKNAFITQILLEKLAEWIDAHGLEALLAPRPPVDPLFFAGGIEETFETLRIEDAP